MAMTRNNPCSRPNSARICEVSLYSTFRTQMHRSRTRDIGRIIGQYFEKEIARVSNDAPRATAGLQPAERWNSEHRSTPHGPRADALRLRKAALFHVQSGAPPCKPFRQLQISDTLKFPAKASFAGSRRGVQTNGRLPASKSANNFSDCVAKPNGVPALSV